VTSETNAQTLAQQGRDVRNVGERDYEQMICWWDSHNGKHCFQSVNVCSRKQDWQASALPLFRDTCERSDQFEA
jgi:hypothetical protein